MLLQTQEPIAEVFGSHDGTPGIAVSWCLQWGIRLRIPNSIHLTTSLDSSDAERNFVSLSGRLGHFATLGIVCAFALGMPLDLPFVAPSHSHRKDKNGALG
jgi:hypothetical protein